jgi:RNA polymerase sigma factor (TIGR02999 family)
VGIAAPDSVTFWLQQWQGGADGALDQLTRLVYNDLRRLAAIYLRDENQGHTLQATALVHEFYLRISSVQEIDWHGRGHFISVAAQMMRRILIDHARRRHAAKRERRELAAAAPTGPRDPDLLDVDRALEKLAGDYPRHARIVELRFFGGLDAPEISCVLDLSLRTVERDWQFAKAWLQREVAGNSWRDWRPDSAL